MKNSLDFTDVLKEVAFSYIELLKKDIKSGKAIKRAYSPSTKKRRKYYGLQTNHIDLTGNDRYSRHSYRGLDRWDAIVKGKTVNLYTDKNIAHWLLKWGLGEK